MARRLIVDTGVLIGVERSALTAAAQLQDDDDVAIAAVSVAELPAGVELADDRHRPGSRGLVAAILEVVPVIPYDEGVAHEHAPLLGHVPVVGRRRGAHDLIVAATSVRTGRVLLTTDAAARFGDLPGVKVLDVA